MREASISRTATDTDSYAFFVNKNANERMTAARNIPMGIDEAISTIQLLENEFDSHDFIRQFIYHHHASYGALLQKSSDVKSAHAQIANFLRINSLLLKIREIEGEKSVSPDIFGNLTPCAKWIKTN